MSLRKKLRAFVSERLAQPGEHKKVELAAEFMSENKDFVAQHTLELVERYIQALIKEFGDEPQADPLPIFNGFPTAIAIAPGVIKATANCTLDDLGAGLQYREENVKNARDRLKAYVESMASFVSLRTGETETVGQCQERLRKQGPRTTNTEEIAMRGNPDTNPHPQPSGPASPPPPR